MMDIPSEYLNQIVTGDARKLAQAIPDESVDLIFTDPVYDRIDDYHWLAETAKRILKPNRAALVWSSTIYLPDTLWALINGGLSYKWQGIWYSSNNMQFGAMGFCNYTSFFWLEKGKSKVIHQTGDVCNIPIPNGTDNHNHKWNKRPEVIERFIHAFTNVDSIVVDFFCGGGTVPAVCKMLGRDYIAFEIVPETADIARERVRNTQPPLFVLQPEQVEMEL